MLDRNEYDIDIQPGPWPSSGIIGFVRGPEDEAYQPMYRVTQAERDSLKGYWPRRRAMKTFDVIEKELKELQKKADAIVEDEFSYTQELRALAFDLSSKIGSAMKACKIPTTEKAPF